MANKRFWLGILVMVLVFGVGMLGCSTSSTANYYRFGNVSDENCAQIIVSPVYKVFENKALLKSDYPFSDFVKIDGQGDNKQWQHPPIGTFNGVEFNDQDYIDASKKAIVKVTPGIHTFTITFFFDEEYEVPLSITYDCRVGKGYSFSFLVQKYNPSGAYFFTQSGGEFDMGVVNATIVIEEYDINEKGNFKYFSRKEVEKKTELLNLRATDSGRVKKRMQ